MKQDLTQLNMMELQILRSKANKQVVYYSKQVMFAAVDSQKELENYRILQAYKRDIKEIDDEIEYRAQKIRDITKDIRDGNIKL